MKPRKQSSIFVTEATEALNDVRGALSTLVHSVGANPSQPQELARRFGLDKTLTWKIARFICDDDSIAAAGHLPGRSSIRNLVEALERDGAEPAQAALVHSAMDRLDELVSTHSGDRETFQIMLGSASSALAKRQGEASRKMFYQGSRAIWGVRARVHVSLHFVAPSVQNPDTMDLAVVAGFIDFSRLRPDASWTIAARQTAFGDGTPRTTGSILPMDDSLSPDDPPLIRRFCSDPLPNLNRSRGRGDVTRFELAQGPIGYTAGTTCILGWIARNEVGRYRMENDLYGEHIVRLSTPAEVLYHELYVHESLDFAHHPKVSVHSDLPGGPIYPSEGIDKGLIPVHEDPIELSNPRSARATDIPNYREMIDYAMERAGWNLANFHAWRFRLKYPPIPALAVYRYSLPEKPRP